MTFIRKRVNEDGEIVRHSFLNSNGGGGGSDRWNKDQAIIWILFFFFLNFVI